MSSSHVYEVAPKDGEAADKRNTRAPNSVIQGMDDELTPPMSLDFDFGDIPDLQDLLEANLSFDLDFDMPLDHKHLEIQ